jgi:hypothetical protein
MEAAKGSSSTACRGFPVYREVCGGTAWRPVDILASEIGPAVHLILPQSGGLRASETFGQFAV